ncbi:MAG TPA: twin-arginine translocase subunit TatC [Rhodanobacter sp.]|nr:twin-arginine translocase subunit TatC [Rhodanobacter sp.]
MNDESTSPGSEGEMGLMNHLLELRARLLKAILSVLLLLVALLPFAQRLYGWLAKPLIARLPKGGHMIAIEVTSPFLTPIKLAFVTALFLAMPAVLYQLWAFISPGLYRHEKRLAVPLLVSSVLLFYLGCAFAYFLVLPAAFHFLAMVTPASTEMMTDISKYLDFVLTMFFAFGLCFEVPVAVVLLAALGVVTPQKLRQSRRYVIVGAFVIAAVLSPPDVLSQFMLAVPIIVLYELGVFASGVLARSRREAAS